MSDIDTWALDNAVNDLRDLVCDRLEILPDPEIDSAFRDVQYEIDDLECEASHWDEDSESQAGAYVRDLLVKIRMGVYDEEIHGSLYEILEEIERTLH